MTNAKMWSELERYIRLIEPNEYAELIWQCPICLSSYIGPKYYSYKEFYCMGLKIRGTSKVYFFSLKKKYKKNPPHNMIHEPILIEPQEIK